MCAPLPARVTDGSTTLKLVHGPDTEDGVMEDAIGGPQSGGPSWRRAVRLLPHVSLIAGLVPAFLYLAPPSRWDRPLTLVTLAVLAILADRAEVPLPHAIRLDATIALTLIGVVLLGPLPALLIALTPLVVSAATGGQPLLRAGTLPNIAAFGWEMVAVSVLLTHAVNGPLDHVNALPWLLVAGPVQLLINWALGPALYAVTWRGEPTRDVFRLLLDLNPTVMLLITSLGALTAALAGSFGMLALAVFAVTTVLPQSALTFAARPHPVAHLDRVTATRRYAHAIALQLGLSLSQRRHLRAVVMIAATRGADAGDPVAYAVATMRDPSRASCEAGHVSEWWNGSGGPAGLRGPVTPLAARIAAVADSWSALTAAGTPELSHCAALEALDDAAGTRFDPYVVAAAHAVVAQERVSEAQPAPEPRLHRLGVSARLRAALAAG
jgi:HD domain